MSPYPVGIRPHLRSRILNLAGGALRGNLFERSELFPRRQASSEHGLSKSCEAGVKQMAMIYIDVLI